MSNKKKYTVYETGECSCDLYKYGAFGVCPECNGTGIHKREVDLLEALRELGIIKKEEVVIYELFTAQNGKFTYRLNGFTLEAGNIGDAIKEAYGFGYELTGWKPYDSNEVTALP